MALRKKNEDGASAVIAEAKAAGLKIGRDEDGTYFCAIPGTEDEDGELLELVDHDPKALLADALAIQAMEREPELYSYDTDEADVPYVEVNGIDGKFEGGSFGEAFAKAQAAYAQSKEEAPAKKTRKGRAKAAPEAAQRVSEPEAEVLPPEEPKGNGTVPLEANADALHIISEGFRKLSETLATLAGHLARKEALVPFVKADFAEDELGEPKSRIKRER